ncbi:MAG: peptide chain release factor N(5)-glutamine methyltransferase [Bacteroidales bacterium]
MASPEKQVTPETWVKFNEICDLLKEFRPIQYILGETEFMGRIFRVRPGVLIPRPETEELADLVIRENRVPGARVLDIGTGSGAIAVTLALEMDNPAVTAIDFRSEIIALARENSLLNGATVNFTREDILNPVNGHPQYDIIVSNPPYVMEKEKSMMSPVVTENEPHDALFVPDGDPLVFYRAIVRFAEHHLTPGGRLYLEINEALGQETCDLVERAGYSPVRLVDDINGKNRFISARKNG